MASLFHTTALARTPAVHLRVQRAAVRHKASFCRKQCSLLLPSTTLVVRSVPEANGEPTTAPVPDSAEESTVPVENPELGRRAISAYIARREYSKAEEMFLSMKEKHIRTGNKVIKAWFTAGKTDRCWALFEKLPSVGLQPDLFVYTTMLRICLADHDLRKAPAVFEQARKTEGRNLDTLSYNLLMQLFITQGKFEEALSFLDEMPMDQVDPDIVTFNTLISGLARGRLESSRIADVFHTLVESLNATGLKYDAHTYRALIRVSIKLHDTPKATRYLEELVLNEIPIETTLCATLINDVSEGLYSKGSGPQKVMNLCWKLYVRQEENANTGTMEVLEAILSLFVRLRQWSHAFGVAQYLTERQHSLSQYMYETLLRGIAASKGMDNHGAIVAEILVEEILNTRHQLTLHAYTSLIEIFLKAKDLTKAESYLDEMLAHKVFPGTRVYNHFLEHYADSHYITNSNEALQRALDIFQRMKERSLQPDTYSYAALIRVACKARNSALVDKLLKEMGEEGVKPSTVMYSIILQMYSKEKDPKHVDEAWRYFREMKEKGINPNVVTYTTMITLCGTVGDIEAGKNLLEEMQEEKIQPNEHTYTSLIHLAGKVEDIDLAYEYFRKIPASGLQVNSAAYCVLINACGNARKIGKVLELHDEMKAKGMRMDLPVFCNLIHAAGTCGRTDLVYRFFDELTRQEVKLNHQAYQLLSSTLEKVGDREGAAAIMQVEQKELRSRRAASTI